jgi:hypothetical protein
VRVTKRFHDHGDENKHGAQPVHRFLLGVRSPSLMFRHILQHDVTKYHEREDMIREQAMAQDIEDSRT